MTAIGSCFDTAKCYVRFRIIECCNDKEVYKCTVIRSLLQSRSRTQGRLFHTYDDCDGAHENVIAIHYLIFVYFAETLHRSYVTEMRYLCPSNENFYCFGKLSSKTLLLFCFCLLFTLYTLH